MKFLLQIAPNLILIFIGTFQVYAPAAPAPVIILK